MVNDLYRGKVINHGIEPNELDWVYGNLVVEKSTGRTFIVDLARFDENTKLCDVMIEVDPETVGQYTGSKDKNGVKIFEGDMLAHETICGELTIGFVKYGQEALYGRQRNARIEPTFFIQWDEDSKGLRTEISFWAERSEVIGNP